MQGDAAWLGKCAQGSKRGTARLGRMTRDIFMGVRRHDDVLDGGVRKVQ